MAETPLAARATPYMEPAALGVPVADFLDNFTGEGCDDQPQTLRFELHDAETDAQQIVRMLARLSNAYGRNPCVMAFARCLVGPSVMDNDRAKQFEIIATWVLDNVVYQADPRGIEYVKSPVQMLREWNRLGRAYGDCDDHVLLFNSLLRSLGFETRVVAVKLAGQEGYAPDSFNHVLSQVKLKAGWKDFDACNKSSPMVKLPGDRITL